MFNETLMLSDIVYWFALFRFHVFLMFRATKKICVGEYGVTTMMLIMHSRFVHVSILLILVFTNFNNGLLQCFSYSV